jgi:hypothetical protein
MSDVEEPASDGGAGDEQAIVNGRIAFVALLKNVCGLNQRVSVITASGITSLLNTRYLKAVEDCMRIESERSFCDHCIWYHEFVGHETP